jgi:hypothetical protein
MTLIEVAKKYLGMAEKPGNVFDESTSLGKIVKKAGQKDGEPWCCYYQEAIFCEAYPKIEALLRKLFSANCFQTYVNFFFSGKFKVYSYPVVGGLILFQMKKEGQLLTTGHAALCIGVTSKTQFTTNEGNTDVAGSREGGIVAEKKRDTLPRDTGLNFLCCIVITGDEV